MTRCAYVFSKAVLAAHQPQSLLCAHVPAYSCSRIVETAHSRFAFYTHICGKPHATQPSTTDRKAVQFSAHQG